MGPNFELHCFTIYHSTRLDVLLERVEIPKRPCVRYGGEPLRNLICHRTRTFSALAYVAYGLATEGWMLYVIIVFGSLGGLANPAIKGMISNSIGPQEQGQIQGTLSSLTSLAGILGPPIFGLIVQGAGYEWAWGFVAGSMLVAATAFFFGGRMLERRKVIPA